MVNFFKKLVSSSKDGLGSEPLADRLIAVVGTVLSLLIIVASPIMVLVNLWVLRSPMENRLLVVLLSLVLVMLAVILLALVRRSRFAAEETRHRETPASLPAQHVTPAAGSIEPLSQDIERLNVQMDQAVKLLQEINENSLLDEAGRRRKAELLARQERKRMFTDIDKLVQDREWAQAKAMLENMQQKYPETSEIEGYIKQVEDLRKQTFNEELAQTRRRIADFVAISAWDKATRMAEQLLEKHPDMPAAKELLLHLRDERGKFREEQIKRMYAEIQRSIGKKRWNDALSVTRQLMEKYPDSIEAETLHGQLSTLETNAEIEKRQHLEEQIKDLIHRRNFIQARELARYVLEHFPTSPQASALRKQIEKLEELARQQEKELQL